VWGEDDNQRRLSTCSVGNRFMGSLAQRYEYKVVETQKLSEKMHDTELFGLHNTEAKYRLVLELQDLKEELASLEKKQKTHVEDLRARVRVEFEPTLYNISLEIINTSQKLEAAKEDMRWQVSLATIITNMITTISTIATAMTATTNTYHYHSRRYHHYHNHHYYYHNQNHRRQHYHVCKDHHLYTTNLTGGCSFLRDSKGKSGKDRAVE
jgi:hypothetical protein